MLVCVKFNENRINPKRQYAIIDTDDYTEEYIFGRKLLDAIESGLIEVNNIELSKDSLGDEYYCIKKVKLINEGYTELSKDLCINIGDTCVTIWYKRWLYDFELSDKARGYSIWLRWSYFGLHPNKGLMIHLGIPWEVHILLESEINIVMHPRDFQFIHITENKECSKLDFQKRLLLC